ncbi:hypothetical protein G2W53_021415 [Senna tora]|uniref:Uncharacterized protein n=1 Tax=Senna tora TaxID=362788 RepID=A0A834TLX2_9FABA|nr:hypothetical protein G2W53_021415 [Senna tora]
MCHLLLQPQSAIQTTPRSEHENPIPTTIRRIRIQPPTIIEEPVMNIPKQIHKQPIHENRLVPPEIPLQSLHSYHALLIDANRQNGTLLPFLLPAASYHDVVPGPLLAELGLRRSIRTRTENPSTGSAPESSYFALERSQKISIFDPWDSSDLLPLFFLKKREEFVLSLKNELGFSAPSSSSPPKVILKNPIPP